MGLDRFFHKFIIFKKNFWGGIFFTTLIIAVKSERNPQKHGKSANFAYKEPVLKRLAAGIHNLFASDCFGGIFSGECSGKSYRKGISVCVQIGIKGNGNCFIFFYPGKCTVTFCAYLADAGGCGDIFR